MTTLYQRVTELHGTKPWGSVLDAGTGRASLRWLMGLPTTRLTAVTGSGAMLEAVKQEAGAALRPQDALLLGNWLDPGLLAGERFEVVIADYLLGAIEGFAPYWQDQLFERLRPLVKDRLYVMGLEPYVPYRPDDAHGELISRLGRTRDACLLLAGERPYREYPMDWAIRQLERSGFRIIEAQRIAIRYGERFISSQLDACSYALDRVGDRTLAVGLHRHLAALRAEALARLQQDGGLQHGHDYLLVAEPCAR